MKNKNRAKQMIEVKRCYKSKYSKNYEDNYDGIFSKKEVLTAEDLDEAKKLLDEAKHDDFSFSMSLTNYVNAFNDIDQLKEAVLIILKQDSDLIDELQNENTNLKAKIEELEKKKDIPIEMDIHELYFDNQKLKSYIEKLEKRSCDDCEHGPNRDPEVVFWKCVHCKDDNWKMKKC